MHVWDMRRLKSLFLPGGAMLLVAVVLLSLRWLPLTPSAVRFFFDAVYVAAFLLAWRFHTTRILFCSVVLALGHYAIESIGSGSAPLSGPGRTALETVALLIPADFIVLTFFPERSSERSPFIAFVGLLFFEATFVAVFSRPDQPEFSFLHWSPIHAYSLRLPQLGLFLFVVASGLLLFRIFQFQRAIDNGMLWSLIAAAIALNLGGAGRSGTAYFGVAGFILASSIIENSYSLAYQDELTGLRSRRAFNDALLQLKAPYAVAAVDIDHFKNINDTYGHDTGDQVLRLVASKLSGVSGGGKPFRVGGEEFTILFPGKTAKEVMDSLELLRMNIESTSFQVRTAVDRRKTPRNSDRRATASARAKNPSRPTGALAVTVSIGVAESQPKRTADDIIKEADKALYRAKQGGRNRIELPGPVRRQRKAKDLTPKP